MQSSNLGNLTLIQQHVIYFHILQLKLIMFFLNLPHPTIQGLILDDQFHSVLCLLFLSCFLFLYCYFSGFLTSNSESLNIVVVFPDFQMYTVIVWLLPDYYLSSCQTIEAISKISIVGGGIYIFLVLSMEDKLFSPLNYLYK